MAQIPVGIQYDENQFDIINGKLHIKGSTPPQPSNWVKMTATKLEEIGTRQVLSFPDLQSQSKLTLLTILYSNGTKYAHNVGANLSQGNNNFVNFKVQKISWSGENNRQVILNIEYNIEIGLNGDPDKLTIEAFWNVENADGSWNEAIIHPVYNDKIIFPELEYNIIYYKQQELE